MQKKRISYLFFLFKRKSVDSHDLLIVTLPFVKSYYFHAKTVFFGNGERNVKSWPLTKMYIFFWQKKWSKQIFTFDEHFDFWGKFWFLTKIYIFYFCDKKIIKKILTFDENFDFWLKFIYFIFWLKIWWLTFLNKKMDPWPTV